MKKDCMSGLCFMILSLFLCFDFLLLFENNIFAAPKNPPPLLSLKNLALKNYYHRKNIKYFSGQGIFGAEFTSCFMRY